MSRRGKRRKGQPTAIGDIVGQVLGDLGLDAVARAQRIGVIWESAVGRSGGGSLPTPGNAR